MDLTVTENLNWPARALMGSKVAATILRIVARNHWRILIWQQIQKIPAKLADFNKPVCGVTNCRRPASVMSVESKEAWEWSKRGLGWNMRCKSFSSLNERTKQKTTCHNSRFKPFPQINIPLMYAGTLCFEHQVCLLRWITSISTTHITWGIGHTSPWTHFVAKLAPGLSRFLPCRGLALTASKFDDAWSAHRLLLYFGAMVGHGQIKPWRYPAPRVSINFFAR